MVIIWAACTLCLYLIVFFLYNIYQCGVQHKVVVIVVVVTNNAINEMDSKDEKNVSDGGKCQLLYQ